MVMLWVFPEIDFPVVFVDNIARRIYFVDAFNLLITSYCKEIFIILALNF